MRPGMIEVTGVSLEVLVRAAYNPSRPQGLGHFHYAPGDLTDAEVSEIVERGKTDRHQAISMDYVKGRSCKFNVRKDGDRLYINSRWYDHSDGQLRALLTSVGLSADLLDKAREIERLHIERCCAEAIAFLQSHGGSYVETRDSRLSDDLTTGLCELAYSDQPKIKREWLDGGDARYSMLEKAA